MTLEYVKQRIAEIQDELNGNIEVTVYHGEWLVYWSDNQIHEDMHTGRDLVALLEGMRIYVLEWRQQHA